MKSQLKPYPGTQAVIRAMSLLKKFTDAQPEWGLTALSQSLQLNKTTVFRILTALESEGMLMRGRNNEMYQLGHEIVVLGGLALRSNDLRTVSRPALKHLASVTGETVTLEIPSGDKVLIIDEVIGEHLMNSTQSLGTRWPFHATSTGLALLSELSADELEAFLERPLLPITPKTIISVTELRAELEMIRNRGYAVANETLEIGLVVVGSVIRDHDGDVVAAISLAAPAIRLPPERIAEFGVMVRETAVSISKRLGYSPA